MRGKTGQPIRVATRRRSPSSPRLRAAAADATKLSRRRRAEPRVEPHDPHGAVARVAHDERERGQRARRRARVRTEGEYATVTFSC